MDADDISSNKIGSAEHVLIQRELIGTCQSGTLSKWVKHSTILEEPDAKPIK